MDAGHIAQGTKLTGSSGGGIVVGMLGGLFTALMSNHQADKERTPGIMQGFVRVNARDRKYNFGFLGAADTEETPDSLARGAFAKLVKIITTGTDMQAEPSAEPMQPAETVNAQ